MSNFSVLFVLVLAKEFTPVKTAGRSAIVIEMAVVICADGIRADSFNVT